MLTLRNLAPALTLSVAAGMSSCNSLGNGPDNSPLDTCPPSLKNNLRWNGNSGASSNNKTKFGFSLRHSISAPLDIQEFPLKVSGGELKVTGKLNGWNGGSSDTTFTIDTGGMYGVILPGKLAGTEFAYCPDLETIGSQSATRTEKSRLGFVSGIEIGGVKWERLVCRIPQSYEGGSDIQLGLLPLSACAAVMFDVANKRMVLASKSADALIGPRTGDWNTVPWEGFGNWIWSDPQGQGFYNPLMPAQGDLKTVEMPYIEVSIDGIPMRAVIDTGCDAGICFFQPQPLANEHLRTVETIGADTQVKAGLFTGKLQIGQLIATGLTAYVIDSPAGSRPYDCIIGNGFFMDAKFEGNEDSKGAKFVLDFKAQRTHISPNK